MEDWKVERLHQLPTALEFASQVEARNMPVVYEGSIKNWSAYTKWHPADGGLDYLKGIASGAAVQAMLSTSGSNFYGNIRSHERVALSFGDYLDYASHVCMELQGQVEESGLSDDSKQIECCPSNLPEGSRLFLAQAPMFNKEQQESSPLRVLMQDITMPSYLISSSVTNINLWMSAIESKSSTHYDPYHNMLCVVAGQKQVTLWPPCATPFLYPYPVHGEASNHSSIDFVKPDDEVHPLFEHASNYCQVVMLQAGDALFIPEGWYHQVNSDNLTIAVNLWWPSAVASALNSHMNGYYLRRIVSSLLDHEKERIVEMATCHGVKKEPVTEVGASKDESSVKKTAANSTVDQSEVIMHACGFNNKQESMHTIEKERKLAVQLLTPLQKQCLQSLVLTCGSEDTINAAEEQFRKVCVEGDQNLEVFAEVKGEGLAACLQRRSSKESQKLKLSMPRENIVAQIFSILDPLALKQVLVIMVNHFPRTLEKLILHRLSPLAAELLTRKFDEMDKIFPEIEQGEFYKAFYSVFESSKMAISALLDGKEAFSAVALDSVLERYLGLSLASSLA